MSLAAVHLMTEHVCPWLQFSWWHSLYVLGCGSADDTASNAAFDISCDSSNNVSDPEITSSSVSHSSVSVINNSTALVDEQVQSQLQETYTDWEVKYSHFSNLIRFLHFSCFSWKRQIRSCSLGFRYMLYSLVNYNFRGQWTVWLIGGSQWAVWSGTDNLIIQLRLQ